MRKRVLPLLLVLALLLSGCGRAQNTTEQSCLTILKIMLDAAPEAAETDQLEWYMDSELDDYLALYYGLPQLYRYDGAAVCLGGLSAFELAVLMVPEAETSQVTQALQDYLLERLGAFTGYAPQEAQTVEQALVLTKGQCVALIISQDPDGVRSAFESCFGSGANATGVPALLQSDTLPNGRVAYTDPGTDAMTLYDTTAILSAWAAQDPSSLFDYDRVIYDEASAVLAAVLGEGMTDFEKEQAVYLWEVTHVSYDYDHYKDPDQLSPDSSTPYAPLTQGKGICLGFATTFQLLMDMAGVECITVVGAAFSSQENHAWNQVCLDGEWYCVDTTWDTGIDDPQCWSYFNVTSDMMADTDHQWDYDAVPEATAGQ